MWSWRPAPWHSVMKAARHAGAIGCMYGEPARHAEMHDQHLLWSLRRRIDMHQNIFGATLEAGDALSPSTARRNVPATETAGPATLRHMREAAALEGGREAAADGFDFGKFGHGGFRQKRGIKVAPPAAARYGPAHERRCKKRTETGASGASGGETHFGFRTVREGEKAKLVHEVFAQVAERYDLMNDLMSGGLHRAWKQAMIDWLNPPRTPRPFHLIDVAKRHWRHCFPFSRP